MSKAAASPDFNESAKGNVVELVSLPAQFFLLADAWGRGQRNSAISAPNTKQVPAARHLNHLGVCLTGL